MATARRKKPKPAAKRARKPVNPRPRRPKARPKQVVVAAASALPWTVMPERIARLRDAELTRLMTDLLLAEAYRSNADPSQVVINTEEKAGDEGSDAESPAPKDANTWLSDVATCWQLKAGTAGQPSRLKGEAAKPKPVERLKSGGRFVVVAAGATSGRKAIDDRAKVLVADARKKKVPTTRIEVFTSEKLAVWVNENPPIAFRLREMPTGFCTLGEWVGHPQHKDPWTPSPSHQTKLQQIQRAFESASASAVSHVHIFGRAGVGKTRFALESCKTASWGPLVLYAPQASDPRVVELLDGAAQAPGVRLVLVVDEVQRDDIKALAFAAQRASGRVQLVTIGHEPSPDRESIAEIELEPLEDEAMSRVIQASHPTMPREHVSYVVAIADGFVRLARMAANAVAKNPDLDTATLLRQGDIRQLLDRMLGNASERQPLHVVALLTSVGWTGARAGEGQAIAKHLGLDWSTVQAAVQRFHDQFGIAPTAGDLRYISPSPLGIFLTLEAWDTYADRVRTLAAVLPNDQARHAFNERLRAVVASPNAKEFAEHELSFFFRWQDFTDPMAVDRWAALSGANPVLAAGNARKALEGASDEERKQIGGAARRHLVNALVDLTWYQESFHDAALGLAELAVAENEGWANNATGEFSNRFQLFLGKTACPYIERLSVIDELLSKGSTAHHRLAIGALARIGQHEFSWGSGPSAHALPERQWHPRTGNEHLSCATAALERLQRAASLPGVEDSLLKAARNLAMLLREEPVRGPVAEFLRLSVRSHPTLREAVRREVHRVLRGEKKYWKKLPAEDIAWLEAVHAELEDQTEGGRLRQAVSETKWDRPEEELKPIAESLVLDARPLWTEWGWLTSGEAVGAWDLGVALARADTKGALLPELVEATGRGQDMRIVSAYISERSTREPAGWVDDWLDAHEREHPEDVLLMFDVTWRCASTSRGARRFTRLAKEGRLSPGMPAHLAWGAWINGPEVDAIHELLMALLVAPSNGATVLELVEHRLAKHPEDLPGLEDVALQVIQDGALLRAGHMLSYNWDQLAQRLLPKHARAIARTVFAAQGRHDDEFWFIEHSEAASTLHACVKADPTVVWEELVPYLENEESAQAFAVGFPSGIVNQLPQTAILDWIDTDPEPRANVIARMTAKVFHDGSLGAAVLDRFGRVRGVEGTFFSAFTSGAWSGPGSTHWTLLAEQLDAVAKNAALPGVRNWARQGAISLRRMADGDRKREQERELRGP